VDLPYEAELAALEAELACPARAAAAAAAPATTPAAPVMVAMDAEHTTEEALVAGMAVFKAQLERVRRQKQHAAAEDLARAAAGGLSAAAPFAPVVGEVATHAHPTSPRFCAIWDARTSPSTSP